MSLFAAVAGSFAAGWMLRYFSARSECVDCLNKRLQRQEWIRTAHLDPTWNMAPRSSKLQPQSEEDAS